MIITVGSKIKDNKENSYILDSVLGSGGFGNVYKAHRENDGTIFAVKMLLSSFESSENLLSFQNELHETLFISSDHVIEYIYAHDGNTYPECSPYIIMEYADSTLTSLIENQKETGVQSENIFLLNIFELPLRLCIRWSSPWPEALQYCEWKETPSCCCRPAGAGTGRRRKRRKAAST
ncbi:protein kinase domain-containing protein [Oscillibacter sp.]|uniref:protein kinase domain-containing protein n=1 Tax=Oscillibacter sp. TaxID=1945593 RepID=UPI0028A2B104|nr:protein kinase [Oscillibacter sp.]